MHGLYIILRNINRIGRRLDQYFGQYLRTPNEEKVDFGPSEEQAPTEPQDDEEHQRVLYLKSRLDDLQSSLRTHINIVSRPNVRALMVVNLPNETLTQIFEYLKGEHGTGDIQHLRLVCRRFHDHSSHLLMHTVRVEIGSPSLDRLGEISRHRLIRKGVRRVLLDSRYYSPVLPSDITRFATYHVGDINSEMAHLPELTALGCMEEPEETVKMAVRTMQTIISSWACYLRNAPDGYEDPELSETHVLLLQRAYQKYCRRLSDQRRHLRRGTFNRTLALALARIPISETLIFSYGGYGQMSKFPSFCDQANDNEALIQRLVRPCGWEEARRRDLGPIHP